MMFAAASAGILVAMALALTRALLGPMLYALINFVGTIAILKFFEYRDLGHAGPGDGEQGG
jgi:multisubunit Na+/H+ antiporter MnhF subunit